MENYCHYVSIHVFLLHVIVMSVDYIDSSNVSVVTEFIYLPVESFCRLVRNNDHNYNLGIFRIGTFTAIILLFKISDNSRDKFREIPLPFKNIAEKSI